MILQHSQPVTDRPRLQARRALYVATADKTVRCFKCHTSSSPEAALSPSSPPASGVPTLRLSSRTASLYHQGFPADVTSVSCCGWLLAGGCSDGSVGLLCTTLAASKAKFAAFTSKHAAAVRQCFVRVAPSVSSALAVARGPAAGRCSAGADAAAPPAARVEYMAGIEQLHASLLDWAAAKLTLDQGAGRSCGGCLLPVAHVCRDCEGEDPGGLEESRANDEEPSVREGAAEVQHEFLELLTAGEDNRVILWRGLPTMAEVQSMLRSQAVRLSFAVSQPLCRAVAFQVQTLRPLVRLKSLCARVTLLRGQRGYAQPVRLQTMQLSV